MPLPVNSPVLDSPELRRVLALPRREWTPAEELDLAERLTPHFLNERGRAKWAELERLRLAGRHADREAEIVRCARKKAEGGDQCPIRLKGVQAVLLVELHQHHGVFGWLPVGSGKTLATWLAALLLDSRRPMLLIPGSLVKKTEHEFEDLRTFWKPPERLIRLETYQMLGRDEHADLLCDCPLCKPFVEVEDASGVGRRVPVTVDPGNGYRPDLLMADEADMLGNPDAAVTRRVMRYRASHVDDSVFMPLTGTGIRFALSDFSHLLIAALPRSAPIPFEWHEREAWGQALDEKPKGGVRRRPGALLMFAPQQPGDDCPLTDHELARLGYQQRLSQTPGVIIRSEQSCDQPLTIRVLKAPDDAELERYFLDFRTTGETADGWDVSDAFSRIRHATELGCGFYYKWDPRPPQAWLDARKAWKKFVRETIAESERRGFPLDSEKSVSKRFLDHPLRLEWKKIEKTFKPNSVPVWVSPSTVAYAAAWARQNGPALIWVGHKAVGRALAKATGLSFYSAKGLDENKRSIEKADPRQSAIVSISANKRGRNLFAWNRGLVVAPPQPNKDWEQGLLGRMHRQGQTRHVWLDVMLSCAEGIHAIDLAVREAKFVQQIAKLEPKILIANWDWTCFPIETLALPENDPRRPRWVRPPPSDARAAA